MIVVDETDPLVVVFYSEDFLCHSPGGVLVILADGVTDSVVCAVVFDVVVVAIRTHV